MLARFLLPFCGTALLCVGALAPIGVAARQKAPIKPKNTSIAQKAGVPATGRSVYLSQCAPCHGKNGEGTGAFSRPLVGDKSVGQLARYISESMPPGPGKKTTLADAQAAAVFLHESFYSPLAQERKRPARIALSHMTVRQYKNAVADLVASFRDPAPVSDKRGLSGEYFKGGEFRKKDRGIERLDPTIAFDFGTSTPGEGFEPHQFSIRWSGSVVAPETGLYEFVVKSDHAVKLFVNQEEKPLIDAWVKSGKDTRFSGSIYLIGGRSYPIRLEFSKSTQGVDDSEKKKGKPAPPAFVTLAWKRPKLSEQTLDARFLTPIESPEVFVSTTPFPPDDRSMGYERGDSISREWSDATTNAALEAADYIAENIDDLSGAKGDPAKLRAFAADFAERALRRPLEKDTRALYVDRQFERAPDVKTAIKRVVLLTLKSPRFLYREPGTGGDAFDTASRLAFSLWDSLPDEKLLDAAAKGELSTREQIVTQARRMASDPKAWFKQREFLLQWLKVDAYPDLKKDVKRFADFDETIATDLRSSLEITLESVIRAPSSDLRELLLSDRVFLNGRLAPLYGATLEKDAPFTAVSLNPGERAGVLTHPYILSSFSYVGGTSPIHRGVLIARSVLGRTLAPPPEAFAPLSPNLHPGLTTRQRVALQTKPAACKTCHDMINPLGFTLEKFDAIGRLRTTDNGKPVESTGKYEPKVGPTVTFAGPKDLANFVATSPETRDAFVEKFFQFSVKQPIRAFGPDTSARLKRDFSKNGYNVRELLAQIAVEAASTKQRQTAKSGPL